MRALWLLVAGYVGLVILVTAGFLILAALSGCTTTSYIAPDKRMTIENLSVAVDRELTAQKEFRYGR